MGLFSGQYEKEGAGLPMPESGAARYFAVLFSQFWKLVGANLLFVAFSLPVITLPAALSALNRVCVLLYRNGWCYVWQSFREEFRASFRRSLLPAAVFLLLIFIGYYAMSLGLSNASLPLWSLVFWTVGILSAAGGFCWGSCYFVLSAIQELGWRQLMKNARLLCMLRPGRAVAAALPAVVFLTLTAIFLPLSLFALLLIVPALCQYTVSVLFYTLAEEYVIEEI